MRVVNVERTQKPFKPGYASVWKHHDTHVLVMGNTTHVRGGVPCVWAAVMATGDRVDVPVAEMTESDDLQPSLLEIVRKVEAWAKSGNADAMWWLGDFYEFGSRVTGANGGKALAYYLGAIRREPDSYNADTVGRVLEDGARLFVANHPEGVEDKTPSDRLAFLKNFREFRELESHGHVYYPDVWDWAACVAVAESLN